MPHKTDRLSTRKRASKEEPVQQKPSKSLKARAIGIIGPVAYARLEAAGLIITEQSDDKSTTDTRE